MEYNLKNNINEERSNGDENNLASQDAWDVVGDSNVTPVIKEDPLNDTNTEHVLLEAAVENTGDKNVGPTTEETASCEISQPSNSDSNSQHVTEDSDSQEIASTDIEQPSEPEAASKGAEDKKDPPLTAVVDKVSTDIEQPSSIDDNKHADSEAAGNGVEDKKDLSLTAVVEIASTETGQPSNSNDTQNQADNMKRISGAAQKRYKRLIALNMDVQEARKLCVKPWSEIAPLVGDTSLVTVPLSSNTNELDVGSDNKQIANTNTTSTTSTIANDSSGQAVNQKKAHSEVAVPLEGSSNVGGKVPLKSLPPISGAAKKRYKRLITLNIEAQEARKLCVKPWSEIASLIPVPLSSDTNKPQFGSDNKQLQNKNTNLTTSKIANANSGQSLNQKKAGTGGKKTDQGKVVPHAGPSNVGGKGAVKGKQLSASEQKRFNRLLGCGMDPRVARSLCLNPYRVIYEVRKFKEQQRNFQNKTSSFGVPMNNKRSAPTDNLFAPREDIRMTPLENFRMLSRDHMRTDSRGLDHNRTQSNNYGRSDSYRTDFVDHASPSSSKYSMDHKRTHSRDYERYDFTGHRTDFVDHASPSKYPGSQQHISYPRGPPTKYMRVDPSDHVRTDPMEMMSPRSSRQDFLENPESSKVKIVNRRGPMTKNQMKTVHKALLSAIMNTGGDGAGPKFKALVPKTGWISVSCTDQHSHNWLQMNVPTLRPWSGADLLVVSENERFASAYFPKSETESIECALRLLKIQNEGLRTDLWRVLNFIEDKEGFLMEFSMDESSADTLHRLRGKVTLGFSNIHFNFKDNQ